jgi:nitroimidazol reductase NimA-like FMN-containing flavoprotein (pyridoxamine 5'-phosphate oxidase superfamily)
MFREMRRKKQRLPEKENEKILKNGKTGILAVQGDDGYPYTVPVNYVYENKKIYFHCAMTGHKIDAIKRSDKVSFCVIDKDDINEKKLATNYRSVIVFGRARIMDKETEKEDVYRALQAFGYKYIADHKAVDANIEEEWAPVACVEIRVEHCTGKEGLYLMRERGH